MVCATLKINIDYFFELELPVVLGGLLPLPFPDGLPVVLGAFFNPLDLDIIVKF